MKSKLHLPEIFVFLVAILPIVYLGFIYHQLPEIVPTHFGVDGKPNDFSSKASLWFWVSLLSGVSILLYLLMRFLPKIDPKKNVKYSVAAFNKLGVAIVLFLCLMNLFVIHASQSTKLSLPKAMPVLLGVFFSFLGNLMPTLKPNYFAGIRTPWTLESEQTWRKTHQLAGRLWFAGGISIVIGGLIFSPEISFIIMMAIVFIIAIIPIIFSSLIFLSTYTTAQVSNNRPQTPQPPYTYNVDSVEYDNADKSVHLGATFTYPKTGGPFITLLMITGSGLQDRDETIFNHHPFAVIADYLTKKGYAVLRIDDRNMGKSKGDIKNATSADFANDALASFTYLLHRKEVNKNKIGLIGHSEGGFIAPLVYIKEPRVAFIISLAGPGIQGSEILLRQLTDPAKNLVSTSSYNAYYDLTKNTLQIIIDNALLPDSLIIKKVQQHYADWKQSLPDSVLRPIHADVSTPEMYGMQIRAGIGLLKPWMRYFLTTDPSQFWRNVKCPVLALNGEKDIQVDAMENIPAIAKALQQAGNKNVTTKIFPGLNHLFQHCTKCTVQEYGELEETFSPEVLDTIGNWLAQDIKK